jgi:hypothetical protein
MTEQTEGAETFRGYLNAEAAATRAFIAYKFGEVGEAEVHRLQQAAHAAQERHLAALAAAEVRGAQAVLAAVEAIHTASVVMQWMNPLDGPAYQEEEWSCDICGWFATGEACETLTAARAAAAAAGGGA